MHSKEIICRLHRPPEIRYSGDIEVHFEGVLLSWIVCCWRVHSMWKVAPPRSHDLRAEYKHPHRSPLVISTQGFCSCSCVKNLIKELKHAYHWRSSKSQWRSGRQVSSSHQLVLHWPTSREPWWFQRQHWFYPQWAPKSQSELLPRWWSRFSVVLSFNACPAIIVTDIWQIEGLHHQHDSRVANLPGMQETSFQRCHPDAVQWVANEEPLWDLAA